MKSNGLKEFLRNTKAFATDVLMAPLEVAPRAWRAGREGFGDPKLADLGGLSAALAPAIPALVLGAKIALASPVAGAAVAMAGTAASYAAAGFLPSLLPKSWVGEKPFEQITMRRTTARLAKNSTLRQQVEPTVSPEQSAELRNVAQGSQSATPGADQARKEQKYASIRPEHGVPNAGETKPREVSPIVAKSAPVAEDAGVVKKVSGAVRTKSRNFGGQRPG